MTIEPPHACIMIVDDDEVMRGFVEAVLNTAGWRVIGVADASAAIARSLSCDMILMDLELGRERGEAAATALRELGLQIPILAFTASRIEQPEALLAYGFDDILAKPCSPDALLSAARRWHPLPLPAATTRLATVFGDERLRPMLVQLRDLLAQALLDSDDAALAHRLAGVSGTLGFAALSAAWLAASHAEAGAVQRARIETRRTLATLHRTLDASS